MYCACGHACDARDLFCAACGRHMAVHASQAMAPTMVAVSEEQMLARIADYERVSAILWLILGILQVLFVITIIAGIWNIFAALSRFKMSPHLRFLRVRPEGSFPSSSAPTSRFVGLPSSRSAVSAASKGRHAFACSSKTCMPTSNGWWLARRMRCGILQTRPMTWAWITDGTVRS